MAVLTFLTRRKNLSCVTSSRSLREPHRFQSPLDHHHHHHHHNDLVRNQIKPTIFDNHHHSIITTNQTKIFDQMTVETQTEAPPVAVFTGAEQTTNLELLLWGNRKISNKKPWYLFKVQKFSFYDAHDPKASVSQTQWARTSSTTSTSGTRRPGRRRRWRRLQGISWVVVFVVVVVVIVVGIVQIKNDLN